MHIFKENDTILVFLTCVLRSILENLLATFIFFYCGHVETNS